MGVKLEGFDELRNTLNQLAQNAQELEGQHKLSLTQLFNADFMSKYTSLSSFQELLDNSGFTTETIEDSIKNPNEQWDSYINQVTQFGNWSDMEDKAVKAYVVKKLGF